MIKILKLNYEHAPDGGLNAKVTADSAISGLAFDPIDSNLYWIDTKRSSVLVQSLRTMVKRTVIDRLSNPSAIGFLDDRRQLIVVDGQRLLAALPNGSSVSALAYGNTRALRLLAALPNGSSVSALAYGNTRALAYGNTSDLAYGNTSTLAYGNTSILAYGNTSALAYSRGEQALYLAHPQRRIISRFGLEQGELTTFLSGIGEVADLAVSEELLYWTERGAAELFWIKMDK